jgi:nitronate monooxygenase
MSDMDGRDALTSGASGSRREILKKSSLTGIGLSTTFIPSPARAQAEEEEKERGVLSEISKELMSRFDLRYPIFQAAPGGEALAIAVASAGGVGALSMSWSSPDRAYQTVVRMKQATRGNFYGNYILHLGTNSLDRALEAGCPAVQFSWGMPTTEMVKKIRAAGARLGIQVGSKQSTSMAMEHGPDFMICQGLEAGGHVQGTSYMADVLAEVVEVANGVPVLVAGGISPFSGVSIVRTEPRRARGNLPIRTDNSSHR